MKQLHFLAGLPRSGSTVLSKLLNQNPDIFASSTSPVLDYLLPAVNQLHDLKNNHSAGYYIDIQKILFSASIAFYSTEKLHIIDKNRGWVINYEAINKELQKDPKIIVTLRPIEEVIASFYKIINHVNNENETPEQIFLNRVKDITVELMNASKFKENFCVITYDQIVNDPHTTLKKIETYIGVNHHEYDINNIVDHDPENDEKWGIKDLHKIRKKLENQALDPKTIMTKTELNFCKQLTEELYNAYEIPVQQI